MRPPTGPIRLCSKTARELAASYCLQALDGMVVTFRAERRSDEQSRLMHSMARDLSEQVPWCGQTLSVDDWKRFATAKLKKDRIVFDCDEHGQASAQAGLVVLGKSTAKMTKQEMNELIAWFEWMGAMHGVQWTHEAAKIAQLEAMSHGR